MNKRQPDPEQKLLVLRKICAPLPAAEDYVMVHHPAFRVGKKPFVIAGLRSIERGVAISVNLGAELQHQLLDDPRLARRRTSVGTAGSRSRTTTCSKASWSRWWG